MDHQEECLCANREYGNTQAESKQLLETLTQKHVDVSVRLTCSARHGVVSVDVPDKACSAPRFPFLSVRLEVQKEDYVAASYLRVGGQEFFAQ